jgi:phage gp46-like protein
MSDLQLFFACEQNPCADLQVKSGDLARGNDLSTAIAISLFSDARARPDDVIPDGTDPRGFWADALDGVRWGSRLWLLERATNTRDVLLRAKTYAEESLNWLTENGIAKSFSVVVEAIGNCKNVMAIGVTICRPDGKNIKWRYRYAWDLREVVACDTQMEYC